MRTQSYVHWLQTELQTARAALLALYEQRDALLYEQAPALRRRYMEAIGNEETAVLQAELEMTLLRRKAELIRIALNRREPVDMEKIALLLDEERAAMIASAENSDRTLETLPELCEAQQDELRTMYREITQTFHPALHTDLTQTQRELYEKAVNAYRMQDVQGMRIIHELLFPDEEFGLSVSISLSVGEGEDADEDAAQAMREEYARTAAELSTDYALAAAVFPAFLPLEEDAVVSAHLQDCIDKRHALQEEIEAIRAAFPFNAAATLDDPRKTADYLAQLQVRAMHCRMETAQLEQNIRQMTEAIPHE